MNQGYKTEKLFIALNKLAQDQSLHQIFHYHSISVQLEGGSSSGLVVIQHQSVWGIILEIGWDDSDAAVICKALGYSAGGTTQPGTSQAKTPWLIDVGCTGSESKLEDCTLPAFADYSSLGSFGAEVVCIGNVFILEQYLHHIILFKYFIHTQ